MVMESAIENHLSQRNLIIIQNSKRLPELLAFEAYSSSTLKSLGGVLNSIGDACLFRSAPLNPGYVPRASLLHFTGSKMAHLNTGIKTDCCINHKRNIPFPT